MNGAARYSVPNDSLFSFPRQRMYKPYGTPVLIHCNPITSYGYANNIVLDQYVLYKLPTGPLKKFWSILLQNRTARL